MNKKEKEALVYLIAKITPLPIGTKVKVKGWNWKGVISSVYYDSFLQEYVYQISMKYGVVGWFPLSQLEVISLE